MFRRSDGNTSISPENIAGQSLSVGFRPLPQTTPQSPELISCLAGILGVSLEIGNFCTLSALFNQSWFVRG
ncbi:hypothetical protein CI722_00215 [Shigella sonnei]|uniref:Uncharacterized protein n=1 Tax=Shigella boydii TaxID=621 RepID=A0A9Q5TYQ9_SHIBO|nr:hypothetical protein EB670_24285 [Escherichia coli]EAW2093314.1 hypothetical protein [Salmonella enterica subsp. enterica]EAZ9329468.1 hypothetical protein [Salmonella enterica subsp. enterica serovar Typhimurium]EBH8612060.1 hypothetical protein [Salmonella enterica subsp. enterica serovar 4,[5],12:i:-]EBX3672419.1 hypothetical protein [Salmonella enterica subsp. enterica serovar Stanley]ECI4594583.1 hypothetical protein [Salmonella enterica subsp. enterica serovar Ohio]EFW9868368.1 hypot